jgi:hypothetical protein
LLADNPKALHWNAMRFSVGRAPRFWYDLADEVGLLLADEFMMWTAIDGTADDWTGEEMEKIFVSWVRDNWNHPSIAWWDASNETYDDLSTETVAAVRHLDPTRQWENGGFNPPESPDDPVEDHPYLFMPLVSRTVDMAKVDANDGQPPKGGLVNTALGTIDAPDHPYLINEYAWLWINRDGTPTSLTSGNWNSILGAGPHPPEAYREAYAYLTGGLTAFWRAHRGYAGVLHFAYLTYSRPRGETSDNFVDLHSLTLEPRWAEYAHYAFAPVMVYVDSWRTDYVRNGPETIPVIAINDLGRNVDASLRVLGVSPAGEVLTTSVSVPVALEPGGSVFRQIVLNTPDAESYLVVAELAPDPAVSAPVYSRRKVGFANAGEAAADPPYAAP